VTMYRIIHQRKKDLVNPEAAVGGVDCLGDFRSFLFLSQLFLGASHGTAPAPLFSLTHKHTQTQTLISLSLSRSLSLSLSDGSWQPSAAALNPCPLPLLVKSSTCSPQRPYQAMRCICSKRTLQCPTFWTPPTSSVPMRIRCRW
jgi:hypothetical protein